MINMYQLEEFKKITVIGKISYITKYHSYIVIIPKAYTPIFYALAPEKPRIFKIVAYLNGERIIIGQRNIYKNSSDNFILLLPKNLEYIWKQNYKKDIILIFEKVETDGSRNVEA
jgi:hypothetical protein